MTNTKSISRRIILWFAVSIQVFLFPLSLSTSFIRAQEAIPETSTSDPVIPAVIVEETAPVVEQPITPGPQEPPGPDNTTYTYNSETGLWENTYYTWSPETKQTSPTTEQTYSYNPSTGMWDTTQWVYAPESGSYKPQVISSPSQPTGLLSNQNPETSSIQATESAPTLKAVDSGLLNDSNSLVDPGSLQVVNYDSQNNGFFDNFFNANISVSVTANAHTGDASVLQNTIGGSALTGNASSMATIINMVQSSLGVGGLSPNMFTENIQGDYFGDIFMDPGLLVVNNSNSSNELVVNTTQDVSLYSDISLVAQSGDALVQENTLAGDATSGNATAILNLMNMINSSINTGQSFVGMLNIFGNLEGDVLMPDNLINTLIASNVPTSQIDISKNIDTSFLVNNNNTHTIEDNISATATSGEALVGMNTSAGDATSGSADTNITVFNLVGNHVVAEQALLVFVNVQGTWVGFITNAPAGSNSALLGGNVTNNTVSSNFDATFNSENTSAIRNDIDLTATTGSASVVNNTTAGSATTGDASIVANITNISNSTFSLANWFGLLFINIFGNWNGSFGTNTAFGNIINNPGTTSTSSESNSNSSPTLPQGVRVFAVTLGSTDSSGGTSITSATPVLEDDVPPPTVLSSTDDINHRAAIIGSPDSNPPTSSGFGPALWVTIIGGAVLLWFRRRLATVA